MSTQQRCTHCEAILYLVWDWHGSVERPTIAIYKQWAADTSGSVADRRVRKRFLSQWTRGDGTVFPVPKVAFPEVAPLSR